MQVGLGPDVMACLHEAIVRRATDRRDDRTV